MEIYPLKMRCSWCGRAIASLHTYIRVGNKVFCSDKHYQERLDADIRWGDDSGMIHPQGDVGDIGGIIHRDFHGDDDMDIERG